MDWAWVTCHECFSAFLRVITLSPFEIQITAQSNRCIYIYYCMTVSLIAALPCMCGSFRRTSRALTQLYDQALRPLSRSPTQLTILQVLSRAGEVSQGHLGEMLAMDSTSLTRTLAIMVGPRWITERRGKVGENAGCVCPAPARKNSWCSALVGKSPIAPASSDWGAGLE